MQHCVFTGESFIENKSVIFVYNIHLGNDLVLRIWSTSITEHKVKSKD